MKITDEAKRKELIQMRQNQILKAAAEVFSKKGFTQTQVDEIADLVGLGKGTIYRYFKNKESLFFSTVRRGSENLKASVLEAMAKEKQPIEKIKKAIEAYLKFFEKQPALIRIFMYGQSEFQKKLLNEYLRSHFEHVNEIGEVFKEAQALGFIKKRLNPRLAVATLIDMLNSFIYTWQITGERYSLLEKFSLISELYFTGVLEQKPK